jgi:hypothetical protein
MEKRVDGRIDGGDERLRGFCPFRGRCPNNKGILPLRVATHMGRAREAWRKPNFCFILLCLVLSYFVFICFALFNFIGKTGLQNTLEPTWCWNLPNVGTTLMLGWGVAGWNKLFCIVGHLQIFGIWCEAWWQQTTTKDGRRTWNWIDLKETTCAVPKKIDLNPLSCLRPDISKGGCHGQADHVKK